MPDAWRMGGNNTYYNNYTYYNVTGSDNSTWFLSGTWLLNNRSIATSGVNVTGVILASQNVSTPLLNASCITLSGEQVCNWSAVNGSSGGGGEVLNGTFNETEGFYVYNSTPFLINFNETLLNATIDARAVGSEVFNGTFNETEGVFVYNSTPYRVDFNGTLLNETIDARSTNSTSSATNEWFSSGGWVVNNLTTNANGVNLSEQLRFENRGNG
jgi:hypothetical protein